MCNLLIHDHIIIIIIVVDLKLTSEVKFISEGRLLNGIGPDMLKPFPPPFELVFSTLSLLFVLDLMFALLCFLQEFSEVRW